MRGKRTTQKELIDALHEKASERKRVFKELCVHLASGLSIDCFGPISESTIKTLLELYPGEFSHDELDVARRKAKNYWETLGKRQSDGSCLGNSRSWYYNMSNRYNWSDRQDIKQEHKGNVAVQVISYSRKAAERTEDEERTQ